MNVDRFEKDVRAAAQRWLHEAPRTARLVIPVAYVALGSEDHHRWVQGVGRSPRYVALRFERGKDTVHIIEERTGDVVASAPLI